MVVGAIVVALATLAPQSPAADSLRETAARSPDSLLISSIKKGPAAAREAVTGLLGRAARAPASIALENIALARRIAATYGEAWNDSLLLRAVAKFDAAPSAWRIAKADADSLRRSGVHAYSEEGPARAIVVWRRALGRSTAIGDSAGAAATSGNIGAAFARLDRLDSASKYLERARRLAEQIRDRQVDANAIAELAGIQERRGDLAGARAQYAAAIALRERVGDTRGMAADDNNLGLLAERGGDLREAARRFDEALTLNRRDGRDAVAATNLVNLAGLASVAGDFERGAEMYREALDVWRTRGELSEAADAWRGLGQLESRRGDYTAARADLQEAVRAYERGGMINDALAAREDLAAVLAAAGQLQNARDQLRSAIGIADSAAAPPSVRAGLVLQSADLAAELNARAESERLYERADSLYRRAGDLRGRAEAEAGLATLWLDEGDVGRAQPRLNTALSRELASGDRRAAALTRLTIGRVALARGDTTAARSSFATAAAELRRLGDPAATAAALGEEAAIAAKPSTAESLFVSGLSLLSNRVAPNVRWRLHAGLGSLLDRRGAVAAAARELQAAIADIEVAGRSLALAERRSGFLLDKSEVYVELALVERARGNLGAAFGVSEKARAREMLELLSEGRVAPPASATTDLIAREQDLRRRVAELTRTLADAGEGAQPLRGPDVAVSLGATRDALVRAQNAYADLLLQIREREPRHAELIAPPTPDWRSVARRLGTDDVMIEYLVSDERSLAFVVTHDSIAAIDVPVGRHRLATSIDFVRGVLQPRGVPRLDTLWRSPLRELYRELIAPIDASGLLRGKTRLTIVPHGDLHYLPFAALLDGDRFLIEQHELTVTPSAAVWLALGDRPASRPTAGLLALAPRPEALPASRDEVNAIARLSESDSRVLIGSGATVEAFRREAPSHRVIHLATYGVLNKANPLFSFVELAAGANDDGRLEVHDVFGLRLNAELVVLSACQTALGSGAQTDLPAGDDWVGLARAFLQAGASRVVASLWPVQDRATSLLMERFYREYASGAAPATALAAAQRQLLRATSTADPFYWAAFEVVGQR